VSVPLKTCSAAYDIPLVRAGQIPGGLSGADSFFFELGLAGAVGWALQSSISSLCFPPDAVNDAGNELVVVGSRRDGLRLAAQAA
jgi:hypothetical protein